MSHYPARRAERIAAPEVEPVSLSQAKSFLRIDGSDEDTLIEDLIAAARLVAEEQTGRSLITQSWRLSYDQYVPSVVWLPHTPIQSVSSVKSIAEDGTETTIASTSYHLNAMQELVFETVPSGHRIEIEYVSGYGDAASDVPVDIAQAILLHVAYLYEHRDSVMPPLAAQMHYIQHREVRL